MSKRDLARIPKDWDKTAATAWADGRKNEAVNLLLQPLNAAGENKPKALIAQLSYYLFLLNDFAGAASVLHYGVKLYPDDTELRMNLSACLNRGHQFDKAVIELDILSQQTPDNPSVFDGLANALYQLKQTDRAAEAGTRALILKDAACKPTPAEWRLPDGTPQSFAHGKARVVSFSLWGNNPRYLRGALDNALQINKIYPGWIARFYVDDSVPPELLHALRDLGADIRMQPGAIDDFERLSWRFAVSDDPQVGYFIVRDADSVVNDRERCAVDDWLASGCWFHVMRDWWTHTDLMLAGMWGGVAGVLPPMRQLLSSYKPAWLQTPNMDQWFLRDQVWPLIRSNCRVHDRYFNPPGSSQWPVPEPFGSFHVGQNVHAVGEQEQAERLRDYIQRLPCLQLAAQPVGEAQKNPMPTRINIATPAYGSTYHSVYLRTLYGLLTAAPRLGLSFSHSEIDYADIVTARNYLISQFYFNKPEHSHILFIDSDMGFDVQLLIDMLATGAPVVGSVYPARQIVPSEIHKHAIAGHSVAKSVALGTRFIGSGGSRKSTGTGTAPFVKVKQVGTGILLISRECIRNMIERCPDIVDDRRFKHMPFANQFKQFLTPFNKITLDDRELSEDLSFCHRWVHGCSGTILASTAHTVRHVGSHMVETRWDDRYLAD